MTTPFSIRGSCSFAWRILREHSGLLFTVTLTIFALQFAYTLVSDAYAQTFVGLFVSFVLALLLVVVMIGATRITLLLARGEPAKFGDILPPHTLVWRFLGSGLCALCLSALPLVVGGVLLGVIAMLTTDVFSISMTDPFHTMPTTARVLCSVDLALSFAAAFYIFIRLLPARYLILDGAGVWESIKESYRMTSGVVVHLALLMCVLLVCNLVGMACLFVGLLVTLPLSLVVLAHVYLTLRDIESGG